jgi:hypothetical protein
MTIHLVYKYSGSSAKELIGIYTSAKLASIVLDALTKADPHTYTYKSVEQEVTSV